MLPCIGKKNAKTLTDDSVIKSFHRQFAHTESSTSIAIYRSVIHLHG